MSGLLYAQGVIAPAQPPGEAPADPKSPPDPLTEQTNPDEALVSMDSVEILARAEELSEELTEIESRLTVPPRLDRLRDKLAQDDATLSGDLARARHDISQASRWFMISDIQYSFQARLSQLEAKREPLEAFAKQVSGIPKKLDNLVAEWTQARDVLKKLDAPITVIERIDGLLQRATLLSLRAKRVEGTVIRTEEYFDHMQVGIATILQQSETETPSLSRDFSYRSAAALDSEKPTWKALREAITIARRGHMRKLIEFTKHSTSRIFFQFLLFSLLAAALIRCRGFYRKLGESSADRYLVLRHPWAAALLVTCLSIYWVHPTYPAAVGVAAVTLAIGAVSLLLLDNADDKTRLPVVGNWILLLFLFAHMHLTQVPQVDKWFIGLEGISVVLLAFRFSRTTVIKWQGLWKLAAQVVSRFWIFAAIVGLLCWSFGFDRSSAVLIDGSARLMLLTVGFRVGYDVLASIVSLVAESPWAMTLRAFRAHSTLIKERFNFLLRWALLFYWFKSALRSYALYGDTLNLFDELLDKEVALGSIELQLKSIVLLGVGIALAIYASRFTRFMLEEEVLPRTSMSLGSRSAITQGSGYVVLGFGLFTSLAAVGFELDKIAILVSALGVGIGFGLQNIVQNFVAGIILIFGRPINVGDRVQVGELLGTVSKVGFRASTVNTIQGAEVIVPNSQFVADQVINWSLSDDRRRIELEVGVKYGTDPKRVIELLLKAANEHESVLQDPIPEAIFIAFGANSLDFQLRAWTAEGGRWMLIRSDLGIAVEQSFKEANIEIPFPQRDLHLRSVDTGALTQILAGTNPG